MIKKLVLLMFLLGLDNAQAQINESPQMADVFRADGKIYVVITVISIIFIALIAFLVSIERKLNKLEKAVNNQTKA